MFVFPFHKKLIGTSLAGPVVRTLPSSEGDVSSVPGGRVTIPHALGPKNQNIK